MGTAAQPLLAVVKCGSAAVREHLTTRAGQTEKTRARVAIRERPGRNRARAQTLGSPPTGGQMGGRGGGALRAIHEDRESTKQPPELYKIWVLRRLGAAYLFFFKPNGAKRNINFVPFGRSNSGGGERGAARPAPASAPRAMQQGKRRGGPTRSRSSTAERERAAGAIYPSFCPSRAREGALSLS